MLGLSVVNWINFLYGNFYNAFNGISYMITIFLSIGILYSIFYWFAYPIYYYLSICEKPEIHKRHSLLFEEFKHNNVRYLFFFGFFLIHRLAFAMLIVVMNSYWVQQWVLIILAHLLILIYTLFFYKSHLQNFLHTFNWAIQFVFSWCLPMFLSPKYPNRLKIYGYVSIKQLGAIAI